MSLPKPETSVERNVQGTPTLLQLTRLLRERAEAKLRWADGAIMDVSADPDDPRWENAWWSWRRLPMFRRMEDAARRMEGGCC